MKKLILSILIGGFLSMPLVHAQEEGKLDGKQEKMKERIHQMYAKLNLTEDQKKQLDANKEKKKGQMKATLEQIKAQREIIQQELMKPQLDTVKIEAAQAQVKALQAQMADNRLNSILDVRKILTPEQFSQFSSMMEERRGKWKEKKNRHWDEKAKE